MINPTFFIRRKHLITRNWPRSHEELEKEKLRRQSTPQALNKGKDRSLQGIITSQPVHCIPGNSGGWNELQVEFCTCRLV
eukprot:scaffold32016_cov15-Tisochrysis_lutea.AAC.2